MVSWQHVNLFCKHDVMLQCMVVSYQNKCWGRIIFFYFVLWPTNAKLFHKLSHSYTFRHYCLIFRELVINTLPNYTSISNVAVRNVIYNLDVSHLHLNYYQQLHLKYFCNLARYWWQAPWRWQESVETCRSVVVCEITVHLLAIARNNKSCTVHILE